MTNISDEKNIEKIEQKSKKNMLLGTIFGYLAIGVSVVYGLFLTPQIVQAVGEENYGLYGLTASLVALLLMDFGLGNTINTYLARLRANNDKNGVERFLSAIFKIYLWIDLLFIAVITVLYFIAPYVFKAYADNPARMETLQALIIIVGALTIISFPCSCFSAVISTYEKFSMIKIIDIIQKVLYLGFSILSVQLGWGVIGIVSVNAAAAIFAVILRFLYMRFYVGIRLNLKLGISRVELKSILQFSSWGFLIALFSRLVITITPFILGILSTDREVTLFSLTTTIEQYIFMLGEMTSSFFMAKIARSDKYSSEEDRMKHLQEISQKIAKLQFVVIALILTGFASVGQEFINIWMSKSIDNFNALYWCILLVTGYEIIHIPQLTLQSAMYVKGHIAPVATTMIIKAIVNLGLSIWLSSQYGAIGACYAICAADIVELIVSNITYKKFLKISISKFFASIYVRGGITVLVSLGIGLGLHFVMPLDHHMILKLLANGSIVVVIYLVLTYFVTFNHQERVYYRSALARVMHIKPKVKPIEEQKTETEETNKEETEEK